MRILAPFLWPRKEIILQFRVLFCFLLLAGGRVINLYVPIYSKLIGINIFLGLKQFFNVYYNYSLGNQAFLFQLIVLQLLLQSSGST